MAFIFKTLAKYNLKNAGVNFHRLQIHGKIFDEVISEEDLFDEVLSLIKVYRDEFASLWGFYAVFFLRMSMICI